MSGENVVGTSEVAETQEAPKRRKVKRKARDLSPTPLPRSKTHHTVKKDALGVTSEAAKKIRKLRAQLELKTGERVTMSDAIEHALSKVGSLK